MNSSYTIYDCTSIDVPTFVDTRGVISVMDKELPFQVKCIFWLHHIQDGKYRGCSCYARRYGDYGCSSRIVCGGLR